MGFSLLFLQPILKYLKQIFDFYINSSIHVALAASVLVLITYHFAKLPISWSVFSFVFSGTLVCYNTIKYAEVFLKTKTLKQSIKFIFILNVICSILSGYLFFQLSTSAQIAILFFLFLSVLYLIPLGKSRVNLRNLARIKIYIVSLCWAGVTVLIPILNADVVIENDLVFKFVQRFVFTYILILIFDINDLKYDEVRLKTLPQTIGVENTKNIIYLLLVVFFALEFFKSAQLQNQWIINILVSLIIFFLAYFVTSKKTKYYTLFWVESVPMIWYILILLFT